jgi:hypothetical protein
MLKNFVNKQVLKKCPSLTGAKYALKVNSKKLLPISSYASYAFYATIGEEVVNF